MNEIEILPSNWRLAEISGRLSDVSQELRGMASGAADKDAPEPGCQCGRMSLADLAQSLYTERRLRERTFGADLFGEPAWDLMLDAFIHGLKGKEMLVSSACIAAACPPTTALRYINLLLEAGLLQSRRDQADRRRRLLSPTREAADQMSTYLSAVAVRRLAGSPKP